MEVTAETQAKPAEVTTTSVTPGSVEGTPGPGDSTPESQPTEQDLALDEIKYSERSLEAARALASEEGRTSALSQRDDLSRERRQRLLSQVSESDAKPALVIQNVESALKTLAPDLTADEMEPVLKATRNAHGTIIDAAFVVVGEAYRESINAALGTQEKATAFWAKAANIDPDLDAAVVLPLLAEELALGTKAVKTADPEELLKLNPKLKEHVEKYADSKYNTGRAQGRLDPPPEPDATQERSNGNSTEYSGDTATMPLPELMKARAARLAASR